MNRFGAVLLVFALATASPEPVEAQQPAPAVSIYELAGFGVAGNRVQRTKAVGFPIAKQPFVDCPKRGGVLVGFDVGLGPFNDDLVVYALRPVYRTKERVTPSQSIGLFQDEMRNNHSLKSRVTQIVQLRAKPGYAVSSVSIEDGLFILGISLMYMRIDGPTLNSDDAYSSSWVGSTRGEKPTTIGGNGAPIVGVHGNQDQNVRSLGLIYLDRSVYAQLKLAEHAGTAVAAPAEAPVETPVASKTEGVADARPASEGPPQAVPAIGTTAETTAEIAAESAAAAPAPSSNAWIAGAVFMLVTCIVLAVLFVAFGRRSAAASSQNYRVGATDPRLAAQSLLGGMTGNIPPVARGMYPPPGAFWPQTSTAVGPGSPKAPWEQAGQVEIIQAELVE